MGSYFAEPFNALLTLPAAIAKSPLVFLAVLVVFGPLIWWKWRSVGAATSKATADITHGLRTDSDRKQTRHDTGIGTQEVLVMRPNKVGGMIWFALIFFGGGAVFSALVVLQDAPTVEDFWTFAGMSAFATACMGIIEANQTRFIVTATQIECRRILHRRRRIAFGDVQTVEPMAKSFVRGLRILPKTGRPLVVSARYSGYRELMQRLAQHDPQLSLMSKLAKLR